MLATVPPGTALASDRNELLTDGDRITAVDVRAGKILRFGRYKANIAIDLSNLFNRNTPTAYNQTYDPVTNGATWLSPTTVLNPRFARFNVTIDF